MYLRRGFTTTGQLDINDLQFVPVAGTTTNCSYVAVTGASTVFPTLEMTAGTWYAYSANTDSWIQQGASPAAAKSAGSMFVAKGQIVLLDGAQGAQLATLQDSASGAASLVQVTV
jgi:hypothetical protein